MSTSYPQWISFKKILREMTLKCYIVNEEPLRVGAGNVPGSPIDMPVIRLTYGGVKIPYIPGSSIKGVFRTESERCAIIKNLKVCPTSSNEKTCMDKKIIERMDEKGEARYIELNKLVARLLDENREEALRKIWEETCLLCKIYGATSLRGRVTFSDAYPIDENGKISEYKLGVRAGIAINRRTGTVLHGPFHVEYVEPGARFKLTISALNMPNYALGLLASVFQSLQTGAVKLGGFKTRGFGKVKAEDVAIELRHVSSESGDERILKPLDEYDLPVQLEGLVRSEAQRLIAKGNEAKQLLEKLATVWREVRLAPGHKG